MRKAVKVGVGLGLGAVVATGVAFAVAATVTVAGQAVGGTATITACDDAWTVEFGTPVYSSLNGAYTYNAVSYTGVAAGCAGATLRVTVADGTGAGKGSGTAVLDSSGQGLISLSGTVNVSDAVKIASAISGNPA